MSASFCVISVLARGQEVCAHTYLPVGGSGLVSPTSISGCLGKVCHRPCHLPPTLTVSDSFSPRGSVSSCVCLSMTEPSLLSAAQMEGLALLPLASPCPRIPRAHISRQTGRWAHLGCRYRCQGRWREGGLDLLCVGNRCYFSVHNSSMRREHL